MGHTGNGHIAVQAQTDPGMETGLDRGLRRVGLPFLNGSPQKEDRRDKELH